MKKPKLTQARIAPSAYKIRVAVGLPHWYAMLDPMQDDGFGGIVCAKKEVNSFVYSFIYEGIDCGNPYYATGHA